MRDGSEVWFFVGPFYLLSLALAGMFFAAGGGFRLGAIIGAVLITLVMFATSIWDATEVWRNNT